WKLGWSGDRLSFTWTFTEAILFVVLAIEVGVQVSWRHASELARWSREHFSFGVRSVVSALLLELNAKVDIWMLGLWLDDASVGVYSLAANLAEGFFQLIIVLQNNFNPRMANLIAAGKHAELDALIARARRWIVPSFAAAALAAAAVYPWTLPLLAKDPSFHDSWLSFAILAGSIGALAAWLPFGNLLLMARHPAWNSLLMILVVGVNVAANAVLIPRFGIAGAALGTAIAFLVFALLLKLFARRLVGVRL
ncbi:MAG: polysaccharide biosynthesis C-terminal domain-containing protein, partial [Planctomycetota bacterium]